jgi:hypothetical protein
MGGRWRESPADAPTRERWTRRWRCSDAVPTVTDRSTTLATPAMASSVLKLLALDTSTDWCSVALWLTATHQPGVSCRARPWRPGAAPCGRLLATSGIALKALMPWRLAAAPAPLQVCDWAPASRRVWHLPRDFRSFRFRIACPRAATAGPFARGRPGTGCHDARMGGVYGPDFAQPSGGYAA